MSGKPLAVEPAAVEPSAVEPAGIEQTGGSAPGRSAWLSRPLLILFGWLCVALGFVGIFLPLLPTTPFILLALWCFARSSQRFHDWLYHHPRFGTLARNWRNYGVVPFRAKLLSVAMMSLSLGIMIHNEVDWRIVVVVGAVLVVVASWLVSRPSRPPGGESLL